MKKKSTAELKLVPIGDLVPYANNARTHSQEQIAKLRSSLREFGFVNPVIVDRELNVLAGHGRIEAARAEGYTEVPCVFAEDLTEAQKKAYIIADNRMALDAGWDEELLSVEMEALKAEDFDLLLTGFDEKEIDALLAGEDEYQMFLDKFQQKKTTDDCYTPENVYGAVADWVEKEYNVNRSVFMRPFKPGGDYQHEKYPDGCVVVDNPPFSILAEIVDFYTEHKIRFFLFAPGLATLNYINRDGVSAICAYASITYENGAVVTTSFVTNLGPDDVAARCVPELYQAIDAANDENEKAMHTQLPKYEYPDEVITAAKLGWLGKYGQALTILRSESTPIRQLDAQKESGSGIYGMGLLLSEKAAAEKAAATKWQLSARELEIVRQLGRQ